MSTLNSREQESKIVAVVVPISDRGELTADEKISLKHLVHFLGKYDKYLIVPKGLEVNLTGFQLRSFNSKYFGSVNASTRLMLSPKLYEAFRDYEYILIHHLDSLVFSDQLLQWCQMDFDYIGAPWLKRPDSKWVKVEAVGNGGFSLRKVESFLKVIYSRRYSVDPVSYWLRFCATKPKYVQYLNLPRKYLKRLRPFNDVRRHIRHYIAKQWHEDRFWSREAVRYYPEFNIASVKTALQFAFECDPKWCFESNNYKLPFGCHAWKRYDQRFWEPYLLP